MERMQNWTAFLTALQLLTTLGIILVPIITEHAINPYQRRAKNAIRRLQSLDDDLLDMVDIPEGIQEDDLSDNEGGLNDNIGNLEEVGIPGKFEELVEDIDLDDIEVGYVQKGDEGFDILLDAIANNIRCTPKGGHPGVRV